MSTRKSTTHRASKKNPPRKRREDSFLGIHFDFHARPDNEPVGGTVTPKMIEDIIRQVQPDYIQCDCKGHPGIASYPTRVGTPCPTFVKDQLRIWRDVTARHGVALYMHYSGVIDREVAKRHPNWMARDAEGKIADNSATSVFGPYVDKLMIPMLKELADEYDVDGVWVDGECWGHILDYSKHARKAWTDATGIRTVPKKAGDKHWEKYRAFIRQGFREYLAHYVDTMHEYAPDFQIASNWAYSGHMPEEVKTNVDFISGDFTPQNAFNRAQLEARILAGQGKPWDLMAWSFNSRWQEPAHSNKHPVQLQQEAASVLSMGGGFQAYFKQKRDGSIYPWTMKLMAETAAFCRAREDVCHKAEAVPQAGLILSSEAYQRQNPAMFNPWHGILGATNGTLLALLDNQIPTEVVMEHHLDKRIDDWPVLIWPEWTHIRPRRKQQLIDYVRAGGNLLVIGAEACRTFKKELGVTVKGKPEERGVYVETNGWLGGFFAPFQSVTPTRGTKVFRNAYPAKDPENPLSPAVTLRKLGKGTIAGLCLDAGKRYFIARTAVARNLYGDIMRELFPSPLVKVTGSHYVHVTAMRKNGTLAINLLNSAGPHEAENVYTFDEIPPAGPLDIEIRTKKPKRVTLHPGGKRIRHTYSRGAVRLTLPKLEIHAVLVLEG